MKRIYYWEHKTDESRFLRNTSAREIAEVAHAQPNNEIGVIIDPGDNAPLLIKVVPMARSIKDTAQSLANAG